MKLWGRKKVEGLIAHYGLQEWWFATFTEEECKYIDDRYQPMGLPSHTLTQGVRTSSKPATQFLTELSTWFRASKDTSIAERIHKKVDELGRSSPIVKPGYYNGRHFTTYISDVKNLKRLGELIAAEKLLLELIAAIEAENAADGGGVAPWYYEELAKIYRKQKDYAKEVAILERYASQKHAPGSKPPELLERLDKARQLMASENRSAR
jgi:hypothetical protein